MDIERNIREAEAQAVRLWDAGFGVLCPHLNTCHFECLSTAEPEAYLEADNRLLLACDYVFALSRWRESAGAKAEIALAKKNDIPVFFDEESLQMWHNAEVGGGE